MLSRAYLFATVSLGLSVAVQTAAAPFQFSFAAPTGWRLVAQHSPAKNAWTLTSLSDSRLTCSIGLGAEEAQTAAAQQNKMFARMRSLFPGPGEPVVKRTQMRTASGLSIHKADFLFDTYTHPRLRRGPTFFLRCVYYSFRSPADGRVYSFECWPPPTSGSPVDRALDAFAQSIAF